MCLNQGASVGGIRIGKANRAVLVAAANAENSVLTGARTTDPIPLFELVFMLNAGTDRVKDDPGFLQSVDPGYLRKVDFIIYRHPDKAEISLYRLDDIPTAESLGDFIICKRGFAVPPNDLPPVG